jgi:ribonuclease VapC
VIVIDASAAIALLLKETAEKHIAAALAQATDRVMSPTSYLEMVMVLSRIHSQPKAVADAFLRDSQVALLPIDDVQAELAAHAFLFYGKGRHPARLNLSDCFSYAAAKSLNAPLLYIGGDFAKTDIRAA